MAYDAESRDDGVEIMPNLPHGELFYMMHELSRLISTYFDQAMVDHQITHAQWWGMMHVSENQGATQSELANIMQMGRASAGKLLERLEARGWIVRKADSTDSRVRRVYSTDSVAPLVSTMEQEGIKLFREFLKGITAEEEEAMLVGLRKIKVNAERGLYSSSNRSQQQDDAI